MRYVFAVFSLVFSSNAFAAEASIKYFDFSDDKYHTVSQLPSGSIKDEEGASRDLKNIVDQGWNDVSICYNGTTADAAELLGALAEDFSANYPWFPDFVVESIVTKGKKITVTFEPDDDLSDKTFEPCAD